MKKCTASLFCGLILLAHNAWALPSIAPSPKNKEIKLSLQSNTYLTTPKESLADSGTGNVGLGVGVRAFGNKGNFHFGVEADSLYGLRKANYRFLDVAEANLGLDNNRLYSYVGRKKFEWSQLDSYWGLGLYQPRFRWDYLSEKENGLFGWFVGTRTPYFQAHAFYSPIYIPEQGAPFDIDGGSCRTSSPWFSCPSSSITLFNQATDVRFSLDVPPVTDIITHWGAGASARVGAEMGPFTRASFTHKPMNQFLLSYEGRLDLSTLEIPATIRPRVLYHNLYSADLGWNFPRHAIVASGIWENPIRDKTPSNWNTQEAYKAFVSGITFKTMPLGRPFTYTRAEFSFFHRDGGNGPDLGPFANSSNPVFEPRYAFREAYSVALFTPILDSWASSFLFSFKFIYDAVNVGNILQSDLRFYPMNRLSLNIGVEILGSESRSPVDFISRYQRNDRLKGGIAYVF